MDVYVRPSVVIVLGHELTYAQLYLHCYALDCVSLVAFHPYGTRSIEDGAGDEMVQRLSYHNSRPGITMRHKTIGPS